MAFIRRLDSSDRDLDHATEREKKEIAEARGYEYQVALKVLDEFLICRSNEIIEDLSIKSYRDSEEMQGLVAGLQAIYEFTARAKTYIEQGAAASRELKEEEGF